MRVCNQCDNPLKPQHKYTCSLVCRNKHLSIVLRGRQSPNLGKTMSDETKRRLSEATKGRYKGEKSPSWKGGITDFNKSERRRFQIEVQPRVFIRDNYTCQVCFDSPGYLHVDHIESWASCPELRFDLANCRTVCRPCHYYITFKKVMPANSLWAYRRRIT